MKLTIIFAIILVLLAGCTTQTIQEPIANTTKSITDVQNIILTPQDLQELNVRTNGSDCQTEIYNTSEFSPLAEYSFCSYIVESLNNTEIIIELSKYTNKNDLNGSYQYNSAHLFSIQGLISKDTFGDQSTFRVNNENDYGGEFNAPGIFYYHLWICKDTYLIHITSKGSEDAKNVIESIGNKFMGKFE